MGILRASHASHVSRRTGRWAWRGTAVWWILSAAMCVAVAACSGTQPPQKPLTELHLPGVTQIEGITPLHALPRRGDILAVATYHPTQGVTADRILFSLDGDLYDVGVDGSGLRSLQVGCGDPVTISPDGQWAVCPGNAGLLLIGPITSSSPPQVQTIALDDSTPVGFPAWLPDGRHLAVVTSMNGCSIALYAASPSTDTFDLLALLTFPQFAKGQECYIQGLAWSPDGAWLAFAEESETSSQVYALSTVSVLSQLTRTTSVLHQTVSSAMLVSLGANPTSSPPSWSERGGQPTVSFVDRDWQTIVQVDPATRERTPLLKITDGLLGPLAWTPDGQHLVFTQERPLCIECAPSFTPSHLYVYTP